jgi:fermentation-respiration switch protein FrsA (DUF1100 family)
MQPTIPTGRCIQRMAHNFRLAIDGEQLACVQYTPAAPRGQVLILHGAGRSGKERHLPLAAELASNALTTTVFDFSGHGESTGRLSQLSLARRAHQARAVHDATGRPSLPLVLIGFSMSGQTVCDLVATGPADIRGIVLGCPAAYAESVRELPFGQPEFTATLRRPGSWRESTAFATLAAYSGDVMLIRPKSDEVIPAEVTSRILLSCRPEKTQDIVLDDATHHVHEWLGRHPAERRTIAGKIAAMVD